jgi:23S rRNA (guanosine2251-2'-O)-methyltransferase
VGNAAEVLRSLREKGIFVLGADASAPETIYERDYCRDVCIVIGGEGKGVRPVLRKHCDGLVSIPMMGSIDSLNASVAAGVFFYEVVRQRGKAASGPHQVNPGPE